MSYYCFVYCSEGSSQQITAFPPSLPPSMFQPYVPDRAAVCGLAAQTLLNYVTSLHLLLIAIFQGRNEKKGKTSY